MRKFFIALCLVAFCTVSFVGCNPPQSGEGDVAPTSTTVEEAPADDAAPVEADAAPADEAN